MSFVANFIRFPAVQKCWKSVKIWQSYRQFKGRNCFESQCITRSHLGESTIPLPRHISFRITSKIESTSGGP